MYPTTGIKALQCVVFTLLMTSAGSTFVVAQSDDFNDGNDTGWTRFGLDSAGLPAANIQFPADGYGGKAYRILTPPPPIPAAGPARTFIYRKDVTYTDLFAAVDVLTFDNSLNQAFGFLFRASNVGLGKTEGYVMNYDPNQAAGGRGQVQINRITGEAPSTLCAANLTLDPNKKYRFTLNCSGSFMTGRVYSLDDLNYPIVTIVANDSNYPSGFTGVFNFSRVNSASYTSPAGAADVTFDNFIALPTPPGNVVEPGTPASNPFAPYLAKRTPASRANFHPAANGIKFEARSGPVNVIGPASIKLLLNGADVSSSLAISGDNFNRSVAYNDLKPNEYYSASIVLTDSGGLTSTNQFVFDTFTQDFLTGSSAKVIESEDYNYENGRFQDNPPVSGLNSGGSQVRGNGVGYFDVMGTPGVDYFDNSTSIGSGTVADYRNSDFTGTMAATGAEIQSLDPVIDPVNDTIRQKYAASDLPEYHIRRTEGGEWLNYTRNFAVTNYKVYLRVACRSPQQVFLDKVTSDPSQLNQTTSPLGVFNVPNSGLIVNFLYVPLTDASGNKATVKLGGLETLRTTFGGPTTNVTQFTMTVNYMLFVPAAEPAASGPEIEAADVVTGPFSKVASASVNASTQTITVDRQAGNRFFRIKGSSKYKITEASLTSSTLTIKYAPAP